MGRSLLRLRLEAVHVIGGGGYELGSASRVVVLERKAVRLVYEVWTTPGMTMESRLGTVESG